MGNFEKGLFTGWFLSSTRNNDRSASSGCGFLLFFLILIVIFFIVVRTAITLIYHVPSGDYTDLKIKDVTSTNLPSGNWVPNQNIETNFQYYIAKDKKNYLPDANDNVHKKVLWYDINCKTQNCANDKGYIITSLSPYKSKKNKLSLDLSNFNSFQGTISVLPIPKYKHVYKSSWKDVKSHMTFSFYNQNHKLLATYTIGSKSKPIKFSIKLNHVETLYVSVQSDLKDRIIAGIYSPTFIKN